MGDRIKVCAIRFQKTTLDQITNAVKWENKHESTEFMSLILMKRL